MEHDIKITKERKGYRVEIDGEFYIFVGTWVQANEEVEAFLERERTKKGGDANDNKRD